MSKFLHLQVLAFPLRNYWIILLEIHSEFQIYYLRLDPFLFNSERNRNHYSKVYILHSDL